MDKEPVSKAALLSISKKKRKESDTWRQRIYGTSLYFLLSFAVNIQLL